jgi:polyisoprenoid-binding protein YceI
MVTVHVRLSPAGSFEATTEQLEGEVLTQEGKVRARELKVPLDTLKTGIALRDEHMKEKYLETKKYPYAVLRLGRGQEGRGSAKLVIRNIEKEISGEYKLSEGYIEASFRISLAEFGIKGVRYMGVGVRDEVTISVKAPTREVPKGIREVARD